MCSGRSAYASRLSAPCIHSKPLRTVPCFSPAPATPGQPLAFRLVVIFLVVGFGGFLICLRPLSYDPLERRIGFYKSSRRFVIERRFFVVRIAGFVIRRPAFHLYARPTGRFFLTFPGIGAYAAYRSRICWFNEPSACGCALNGSGVCFCYFIKNKSAPIRHKDFMSLVEFVQSRKENAAVLFR